MIEKTKDHPDFLETPGFGLRQDQTPAAQLQKLGWSFRPRYEDHDETKPIIGVRLTNCAKIFENAQTIQIFDRRTVTLQFGFLQEQSVTLTDDDGALFIEWLAMAHPELAAPMLAVVPAGDPTPGASNTGLSTTKAQLVEYLADAWPEVFGKGGRASQPGADFYTELLALFHDPDRDTARRAALILAAENMAHDFYADCVATLRRAAYLDENKPARAPSANLRAYALVLAAEAARAYAKAMRGRLALENQPPPAEFPEAIDPETIPGRPDDPSPNVARGIPPASDSLATIPTAEIKRGLMVGIIDPSHAKYRQMGQIYSRSQDTVFALISGATEPEPFNLTQLMKLS